MVSESSKYGKTLVCEKWCMISVVVGAVSMEKDGGRYGEGGEFGERGYVDR